MRYTKTRALKNPERAVRCACGLTLRVRNWADHWRTCRNASGRTANPDEIKQLEMHESYMLATYGFKP